MIKVKFLMIVITVVLTTGDVMSQTQTGGDEKKKSLVTSTPVNLDETRDYTNLDNTRSSKTHFDEGTNDPTKSGMVLSYYNGVPVYTKSYAVNGIHIDITYVPK